MFILDTLFIGGIKFVLRRVAEAVDAQMNDVETLRQELLAAQMRLELGEITEAQFSAREAEALARMRESREAQEAEAGASGPAPRRVPTRAGRLEAVELDADRALARWLRVRRPTLRTIAERGTYLDDEDLERLLRLSFPGVDELMALVELARLATRGAWDLVVVDTAPTGHTLRLLAMPETLQRIAGVLDDLHA